MPKAIDLQSFCSIKQSYLVLCGVDLTAPFNAGEFTYATNGHVMVRVDRRDGFQKAIVGRDWNAPLAGQAVAKFFAPALKLPPAPALTGVCPDCNGEGSFDCASDCGRCEGFGEIDPEAQYSTTIKGLHFQLNYVRKILALPAIEISQTAVIDSDGTLPMQFRFDGGIGALMPRKGKMSKHVEVER